MLEEGEVGASGVTDDAVTVGFAGGSGGTEDDATAEGFAGGDAGVEVGDGDVGQPDRREGGVLATRVADFGDGPG